jgi:membrane-associated protein
MLTEFLHLLSRLGPWAYAVIFAIIAAQSATVVGFVLPGASAAVLGGVLAASGVLDVRLVFALVVAATVLGNAIGYECGRRLPSAWLLKHGGRFGVTGERLAAVERFFNRFGPAALIVGRFSPPTRALVPLVAGASQMGRGKLLFYSILGGVCWAAETVVAGYLAGKSWEAVSRLLGGGELAVLAILLAAGVLLYRRSQRAR